MKFHFDNMSSIASSRNTSVGNLSSLASIPENAPYDFDKTISMFQNEIPHSRRHEVITFFNTLLASVAFRQNAYRISQLNQAEFHKFFVQNFDSFARIVSSEKRRLASRKPRGRSVSNDLESPIVFVFHCA